MREIGFMQGRLSPLVAGRIQAFPWEHWRNEFAIGADAGFPFMEWTLDAERLYENPLMMPKGREEIRELSRSTGVRVASLTGDCFMQEPFWKADDAERQALLRSLLHVVRACGELGIDLIVVPAVDHGSLITAQHKESFIDGLLSVADECSQMGVRIVVESDLPPELLSVLFAELPSPLFGVNYDIGNSASLGYSAQAEIDAYGTRILNVHVKDRLLGGTTVPLGTGNADFHSAFAALDRAGYRGNLVLQTARAKDGDHRGALIRYRELVERWQRLNTDMDYGTAPAR